jgi:hypothetical protein
VHGTKLFEGTAIQEFTDCVGFEASEEGCCWPRGVCMMGEELNVQIFISKLTICAFVLGTFSVL